MMMAMELPRGLAHYTSAHGLRGILVDRKLWATHIYFVNDSTEYRLTADRCVSLLDQIAVLRDLSLQAPTLHAELLRALTYHPRAPLSAVFVTSFSEEWDDLSQWRGYSRPGDGYSIIFDAEQLQRMASNAGWTLEKCVYGGSGDSLLTPLLISLYRDFIADRWSAANGETDEEGLLLTPERRAVRALQQQLSPIAPRLKDDTFKAEVEWRLVSPVISPHSDALKYRSGASFLVPYVEFTYASPGEQAIMHVNVGPGPNIGLAEHALGNLMQHAGLN